MCDSFQIARCASRVVHVATATDLPGPFESLLSLSAVDLLESLLQLAFWSSLLDAESSLSLPLSELSESGQYLAPAVTARSGFHGCIATELIESVD